MKFNKERTMRNATLTILVLLGVAYTGLSIAEDKVEYKKKNAVVEVHHQGKQVRFSINSSVGEHVCNLNGTAVMIQADQAAYTSNDNEDKCVALLTFKGGTVTVLTKDCDDVCGMNAVGSMDGLYKRSAKGK